MKLLINVNYDDPTGKFWWDSSIKRHQVDYDPETSVHDLIKSLCEEEGMELSYKGKPQGNIFRDDKNGNSVICGYMYRAKGEVHTREMRKPVVVFWDVWVSINIIADFTFEEIDR